MSDLGLTGAAIVEGSGLSKAYISEFRAGTRNLSAAQQAQLRDYLEAEYEAQGKAFPDEKKPTSEDLILQGLQNMGGAVQRVSRPALMMADHIDPDTADKVSHLIEANRLKVADILNGEFKAGGLLDGAFSRETESAIRELFAMLALNYVLILMLQGRDIAYKVQGGSDHKTIGDWFSSHLSESPISEHLQVSPDQENEKEPA